MTDPLQKLFGSAARVKLMRLFLFNPEGTFTVAQAAARARVTPAEARKEVQLVWNAKLIRRVPRTRGRYMLNTTFPHLAALQGLLLNAAARIDELHERLRQAGAVKLIVAGGIFVGDFEGGLDLLVVGDRLKDSSLNMRVRRFEAELGRELRYAALSTADFLYRLNMNDKLVRDCFDYPHRIAYDKLDIGLK